MGLESCAEVVCLTPLSLACPYLDCSLRKGFRQARCHRYLDMQGMQEDSSGGCLHHEHG